MTNRERDAALLALGAAVGNLRQLYLTMQARMPRGIPIQTKLTQGSFMKGALSDVLAHRQMASDPADRVPGLCIKNRAPVMGTTGVIGELYLFYVTLSNGNKVFVSGYGW